MKIALFILALVALVCAGPQDINANLPDAISNEQAALTSAVSDTRNGIAATQAALDAANKKLDDLEKVTRTMESDLDTMWLVLGAVLVFLLTIGFGLIEASVVRRSSINAVLLKNIVVCSVVAIMWWSFGYGVAYSVNPERETDNPFIGNGKVFMSNDKVVEQREFANWVYSYAFAVFATAIATSSLTDRGSLTAYIVVSVVFSGGIYPIIVHWVWASNGWLNVGNVAANFAANGMIDWSGSGVVHLTGGAVALATTFFAGPRFRRFDNDFVKGNPSRFQSANKVYQGLGVLFLWVGWYGFTCVSTNLSGTRALICVKVATNTTLAAAAGALIAFIVDAFYGDLTVDKRSYSSIPGDTSYTLIKLTDIRATLNGVLAGLVAVSAGVAVYEPWAAVVVGGLAGIIAVGGPKLVARFSIDDPVETFSLFGLTGIWGLFAVGWFARLENCITAYGLETKYGIWYGGDAEQWGVQCFGAASILLWGLFMGGVAAYVLRFFSLLRVSADQEVAGLNAEFAARKAPENPPDVEMK